MGRPRKTEITARPVPTNPCAECKREGKGKACPHRKLQILVRLPDGNGGTGRVRRSTTTYPLNSSDAFMEAKARFWIEHYTENGITGEVLEKAERQADGGGDWWDAFFAYRQAKGLTNTRGMYEAHIKPVCSGHPRDWTKADCERFRDTLDDKIEAGSWEADRRVYKFGWKRARNVWALFTTACKAASAAKKRTGLRVRDDNPCYGLDPPEGGLSKKKQWLTPSEFLKLVSCEAVPVRWLKLYTMLTYTYLRPSELKAIKRCDVDLDLLIIDVNKAWDFDDGEAKPITKTPAGVRKVPIEPTLLPLLQHLCAGLGPQEYLFAAFPPKEDWAATFRVHLQRAGVDRASLFVNSATVKHITLYDLRATGITWRTLRKDDTRDIQREAGHEHYDTTDGYVRESKIYDGRLGQVFPALPEVFRSRFLITGGQDSRSGLFSAAK